MIFGKPKARHLQTGDQAELLALNYLQQQGLQLVCSNYRCKFGELDLVMKDGPVLAIVEVRFRKSDRFGGALYSINRRKQARIIAATQHYVIINKLSRPIIRFDVVAISDNQSPYWIKDAFQT
ncbi:MAG: YraN family protein [Methylomonas sp.]|jgi:putative endonuclease